MKELLKAIRDNNIVVEVVNGELKVFSSYAAVDSNVIEEIRDKKKELIRFLQENNQTGFKNSFQASIPRAAAAADYPLSSSQHRLWILSQFEQGNIGYNIPGVRVFDGQLDPVLLERSFSVLIERHEILRTVFRKNPLGEIRQVILEPEELNFGLVRHDLTIAPFTDTQLKGKVEAEFVKPFDLAAGPLFRATLFRTGADRWIFVYVMHHIISDGWSKRILIGELLQVYNALREGRDMDRKSLRIQYKDYAAWQQQQLGGESLMEQRNWWTHLFHGELPVVDLPSDKKRPALKTYNGERLNADFSSSLEKSLKTFCHGQGCTLFMGLVAAVDLLIYRYTGLKDIIIGTPVTGRNHRELEEQIGFYANTLALRTTFTEEDSFRSLLLKVKRVTTGAFERQNYPFDRLVSDLGLQRDMGRNPLFDIQVIVQNSAGVRGEKQEGLKGLQVSEYKEAEKVTSVFDIVFSFTDSDDGLRVYVVYNTDVYGQSTIRRFVDHLERLLNAALENPDLPVHRLDFLFPGEKQQQLIEWNKTDVDWPEDFTLVSLFQVQAAIRPDSAAIRFSGGELSYGELDRRSDRLAGLLQNRYGVVAGDQVGIMLDRSENMVVAMLAILKCRCSYVPVDPEYPRPRKEYILKDTAARLLVTQAGYIFDLDYYSNGLLAIDLDWDTESEGAPVTAAGRVVPEDLAYVIYTSGSTGEPKGVMITHASAANSIQALCQVFGMSAGKRVLQFASPSFDVSVFEIFTTLTAGATLCIVPEDEKKDAVLLEQYLSFQQIQMASIPPAYLKILTPERLVMLEKLVTGGEGVPTSAIDAFTQLGDYYNAYGPTETTIGVTVYKIGKGAGTSVSPIPIGRPLANSKVYILGERLQLLPAGATGEICIGGRGVAQGYLNNEALTAEKFVENPFAEGEKMYRTGDLGRWLPDGNIEFAGRKDSQVKINGYRIELGEIENVLHAHPAVAMALVAVRTNTRGEKELIAYVSPRENAGIPDLRSYLSQRLPVYMLPASCIHLDEFPVTVNGKIDRQRLPQLEGGQAAVEEYTAPRSEPERLMTELWQEILGTERIGIRHNFFLSGGDSIKILRMTSAARNVLGLDIAISDVYKYNTIEELFDRLPLKPNEPGVIHSERRRREEDLRSAMQSLREEVLSSGRLADPSNIEDVYPMSDIEKGMVYESMLHQGSGIYHDQMVQRKILRDFEPETLRTALSLLVDKHAILRTSFNSEDFETALHIVHRTITLPLDFEDLSALDRNAQQRTIRAYLKRERRVPFEFSRAPLWKLRVYRLGQGEIIFVFQTHHAIIDGWSDASLKTELHNLYFRLKQEPGFIPEKLKAEYKDYVVEQLAGLQDGAVHEFWKKELDGYRRLELFTEEKQFHKFHYSFDGEAVRQLKETAAGLHVTVKALSLAAYLYLLRLLTSQREVIAGVVTNTRPDKEDGDRVLGCFLNTIPVRMTIGDHLSGRELTGMVKDKINALKEYERLSMFELARLFSKRAAAGNPFFDVLFNFTDFHAYSSLLEDAASLREEEVRPPVDITGYGRTNTWMDLSINVTGGQYTVKLNLYRKLRCGLSAERVGNLFVEIVMHLLSAPGLALSGLELLTDREKRKMPAPGEDEEPPAVIQQEGEDAIVQVVAPRSRKEEKMAALWCDLLGRDRIGVTEDFFHAGGQSLLAMRMIGMINREMNAKLSIRDLYAHPTIEGLCRLLDDSGMQNGEAAAIDWEKECRIRPGREKIRRLAGSTGMPENVLLTGATGFVGAHLLKELLENTSGTVYCLVRAKDTAEGGRRILDNLRFYDLYDLSWMHRIRPVSGDMAKPRLGMHKADYTELAEKVDMIYHAAAYMDLLSPYGKMAPANVGSCREVVRLATTLKLKRVIHISTLSIFSGEKGKMRGEYDSIDRERHAPHKGYSASKWVAERIMLAAGAAGLPVQIHRLGLISGDERTGKMPSQQWFSQLMAACEKIRACPEGYGVPMTPVDFTARAIVSLSLQPFDRTKIFHLINDAFIPVSSLFAGRDAGDRIQVLPMAEWLARLQQMVPTSESPLGTMLDFHFDASARIDPAVINRLSRQTSHVSTRLTLTELKAINISFPQWLFKNQ
ncbi:MAG: amino acid adenylation domain-containing protein [Bacteroidetes bacterium]|nr:amino acid adenylation domain-containing protein [Bacteroidota bacterium]